MQCGARSAGLTSRLAHHPGHEGSNVAPESGDRVGQTVFQRRHPVSDQDAAVDVAEDVPKAKVLAEDVGQAAIDHGRAHSGDFEGHVVNEIAMPLLAPRYTTVQFAGYA